MATPLTIDTADLRSWPAPPAAAPGRVELPAIGPRMRFDRDEEIFGQGEKAEYIYLVLEGAVRTCRFTGDGRRQIEEFHLAGEYFGLEMSDVHACSAEAVGGVVVALLRRSTLNELAARDIEVSSKLLNLAMASLRRTQEHVQLLGRRGACERVAAFLLDFSNRTGVGGSIGLPMSRQDIADYLGLTIETVSRTLTQLEGEGVIGLPDRRHVTVRSASRLAAYCE